MKKEGKRKNQQKERTSDMKKKKLEEITRELLKEIGYDCRREELKRTPERVASMLEEIFSNNKKDLKKIVNVYKTNTTDEVILIKNIPFFSFCAHHLLPFLGKIHIAYIPHEGIITGFSNFITIVKVITRRLQLQESLTDEIADTIVNILKPEGVMVIVEARHLCIEMRGEKPSTTEVLTSTARGTMKNENIKSQVMLQLKK